MIEVRELLGHIVKRFPSIKTNTALIPQPDGAFSAMRIRMELAGLVIRPADGLWVDIEIGKE